MYSDMYDNFAEETFEYFYPYSFDFENRSYLKKTEDPFMVLKAGSDFRIVMPVELKIRVESNSIIYEVAEQAPTTSTVGIVGQRAYNTVDYISWLCTSVTNGTYTWKKDEVLIESPTGMLEVTLPEAFYEDKVARLSIYNFKYELKYKEDINASSICVFSISDEVAKESELYKGNYRVALDLIKVEEIITEEGIKTIEHKTSLYPSNKTFIYIN